METTALKHSASKMPYKAVQSCLNYFRTKTKVDMTTANKIYTNDFFPTYITFCQLFYFKLKKIKKKKAWQKLMNYQTANE